VLDFHQLPIQLPESFEDFTRIARSFDPGLDRIWGRPKKKLWESFAQATLTFAMNKLYEAINERGATAIVPSSVVETMGLNGVLATASLGGAKPA
jgi:hypothetical protein